MRNLLLCVLLGLPLAGWAQKVRAVAPTGESTGTGPAGPAAVLDYAEEMPAFTGGEPALRRYLAATLVYPPEALQHALSGTVVVQFVVDEQGRALDPTVVRTSNPVFDAEARRVVYLMPWWAPGRERGHPVRVRRTLPIIFTWKRAG